ncbi:hypothetical protein ACWE42_14600 [Sutcliffiella cohnii]
MIPLLSFTVLMLIGGIGLWAVEKSTTLQRACDWWVRKIVG